MRRDAYRTTDTTCDHSYTDDHGHRRTVRYWVRDGGGYVWHVNGYGQQVQPYDHTGATWRARDGAEIRDLCKAARRRERAALRGER